MSSQLSRTKKVEQLLVEAFEQGYREGREDAAKAVTKAYQGQTLTEEALGVWATCHQAAWGQ